MIVMLILAVVVLGASWGEIPQYHPAEEIPKVEHGRRIWWHTSGFE